MMSNFTIFIYERAWSLSLLNVVFESTPFFLFVSVLKMSLPLLLTFILYKSIYQKYCIIVFKIQNNNSFVVYFFFKRM